MAYIYKKLGRNKEAFDAFKKSLELNFNVMYSSSDIREMAKIDFNETIKFVNATSNKEKRAVFYKSLAEFTTFTKKDYTQAIEFYKKSAEAGNYLAYRRIASIYKNELKNDELAEEFAWKAINKGDTGAISYIQNPPKDLRLKCIEKELENKNLNKRKRAGLLNSLIGKYKEKYNKNKSQQTFDKIVSLYDKLTEIHYMFNFQKARFVEKYKTPREALNCYVKIKNYHDEAYYITLGTLAIFQNNNIKIEYPSQDFDWLRRTVKTGSMFSVPEMVKINLNETAQACITSYYLGTKEMALCAAYCFKKLKDKKNYKKWIEKALQHSPKQKNKKELMKARYKALDANYPEFMAIFYMKMALNGDSTTVWNINKLKISKKLKLKIFNNLANKSSNNQLKINLAYYFQRLGQGDKAMKLVDDVIEEAKDDELKSRALHEKANFLNMRQKITQAVHYYKKAFSITNNEKSKEEVMESLVSMLSHKKLTQHQRKTILFLERNIVICKPLKEDPYNHKIELRNVSKRSLKEKIIKLLITFYKKYNNTEKIEYWKNELKK